MRQNAFPAGPAGGELERFPDLIAAIGGGVPTSKGEGREGMGKGKEGMERGKGGWEGEGGKGKKGRKGRARRVCVPINKKLPLHRCP